jgi:hypothetical protein
MNRRTTVLTRSRATSLGRALAVALAAGTSLALPAWAVAAGDVLVLRPPATDPFAEEILHRVGGELRLHGFVVRQQDAATADPSPGDVRTLLAETAATACVSLVARAEVTVVRVWLASASAMPALFEAVSLQRAPDVPTALAARAVDLLMAALPDDRAGTAPALASSSTPAPLSARAPAGEDPLAQPYPWTVAAGSLVMGGAGAFGSSLGAQLTLTRQLTSRLSAGVRVAAPLVGAWHTSADAEARLISEQALLLLQALAATWGRLRVRVGAGAGPCTVAVTGRVPEGATSLAPAQERAWLLAAGVGLDLSLALSARMALGLNGDLSATLPRVSVQVGREVIALGRLHPSLALDARVSF